MSYWNVAVDQIPAQTGAESVMDCSDLLDALGGLGIEPPLERVLDVGCGTGRLSRLCSGYLGVDIAPNAIQYARGSGLRAAVIHGPNDLPDEMPETIACFSVFTHIGRDERQAYLRAFADLDPDLLLVDILPGEEGGSMAVWYADPQDFYTDLRAAWFEVDATYDRIAPDGTLHRYFACSRSQQ